MSVEDSGNSRLNELIAEYLRAVEDGASPDRDALIDQHPDLADDLRSFFANHDQMKAAQSDSEDATLPPSNPGSDTATIPPRTAPSEDATIPPIGDGSATVGTRVRYFGDYELLEEIARGGMGVVYKARQVTLNRIVALKMILAGQLAGEEDVQRFHAEAEAAANLDHPGIVPIYEIGEHDGQHYFSMGFVDGMSLAERIQDGPLLPQEAAEYTKKVAEAVAFAHQRGVIHRDLKPANVLLDANNEPKVTDFGLAKKVEDDSGRTATGQILGTPSYMPPEQAAGKIEEVTESADVYALGAILYALVTGRPPFQAASHLDTLLQVIDQEPVSPRVLNAKIPQDLETICLKCLQKDGRHRYESAQGLIDELKRYLAGQPILACPISAPARAWRWCKRNPTIALLSSAATALLLLVAFVAAIGYFTTRRALSQSETNLYRATIQLAHEAIQEGDHERAWDLLNPLVNSAANLTAPWELKFLQASCLVENGLQGRLPTWSPDGKMLCYFDNGVGRSRSEIHFLDVPSYESVRSIKTGPGGAGLDELKWSPDGKLVAAVSTKWKRSGLLGGNRSDGSYVRVWKVSTGAEVMTLGGGDGFPRLDKFENAFVLSWNPEGTQLAISGTIGGSGQDATVRILQVSDGKELLQLPIDADVIAWSNDGTRLACGSDHLSVWDVSTGENMTTDAPFAKQHVQVKAISWAPDSTRLAFAGSLDSGVYDVLRKERLLHAGARRWLAVAWRPDGQRLEVVNTKSQLEFWDTAEWQMVSDDLVHRCLPNLGGRLLQHPRIVSSPDSSRTAIDSGDNRVFVWNTARHSSRFALEVGAPSCFSWSPNSTRLAFADEGLKIWNIESGEVIEVGKRKGIVSLDWSREDLIAVLSTNPDGRSEAKEVDHIAVIKAANMQEIKSFSIQGQILQGAVQWNASGTKLGFVGTVKGPRGGVNEGKIVWGARTWTKELDKSESIDFKTLTQRGLPTFGGIAWHPTQNEFLTQRVRTDLSINYTDRNSLAYTGRYNTTLSVPGSSHPLAWNLKGELLATGSDSSAILVWEFSRHADVGDRLHTLVGHLDRISSLSWNPSGDRLVSVSIDGMIKLWDPVGGYEVLTLRNSRDESFRHQVEFSPDGASIAATGSKGLSLFDANARFIRSR